MNIYVYADGKYDCLSLSCPYVVNKSVDLHVVNCGYP